MKAKNPTKILLWAGIILMIGLLIVGCAKKPEPIVEPPGPTAAELEQARLDSVVQAEALVAAEREATEKAAQEAAEAARHEKGIEIDRLQTGLRQENGNPRANRRTGQLEFPYVLLR